MLGHESVESAETSGTSSTSPSNDTSPSNGTSKPSAVHRNHGPSFSKESLLHDYQPSFLHQSLPASSSLILDIDLDFFSTLNPFKVMLTPKQFQLLQKVYFFQFPKGGGAKDGGNGAVLEEFVAKKMLKCRRAQVGFLYILSFYPSSFPSILLLPFHLSPFSFPSSFLFPFLCFFPSFPSL